MVRVVLTGASGLLGTWLRRTAPPDVEIVSLVHRDQLPDGVAVVRVDLRDRDRTLEAISSAEPDLVIHGAYARDRASIVDASAYVAEASAGSGASLLHISTEAVFAGDGRPRDEADEPDPVWDYGRWKADAEQRARDLVGSVAIVRLPLLVSLDPPDAGTRRILDAARDGEAVGWYHDEWRQPAWAGGIAAALWRIVALPDRERQGCWHLPGPELLSRYGLAQRLVRMLELAPDPTRSCARPEGRRAPRELRLVGERARHAVDWEPSAVAP